MSILAGFNTRDSKLGAKIFIMAVARNSFGMSEEDVGSQAFDRLCVEELDKTFEQYNQKHIKNGFGTIGLLQIKNRDDALVCAYRCNHKAERY
jgi:hypothetical protein